MSRGAWLAAGAILAALASTESVTVGLAAVGLMALVPVLLVLRGSVASGGAFAAGAALVALRVVLAGLTAAPPLTVEATLDGAWNAEVASVSAPRDGEQRAVLVLETNGESGLRAYATLPRYPPLRVGDRVAVAGRLRPSPRDGGFGTYLERSGIGAVLDGRSLRPEAPTRPLEHLRGVVDERIGVVLPEPQAGLASALLVGLRERVDRAVAEAFTIAGISHVVAISGWNICLVATLVATLARRLPRRSRSLLIVVTVCLYTLLAGASASVVRAALMAAAVLVARESGRRGRATAVLGIAATAMLVVDPRTVSDPGYRLSVAATAGLLTWGRPVSAWLSARLTRLPGWLAEALGISLAAQAATLPLVVLDFGRLSLVAPATNLIVAPLVAPAMAAAGLAALAGAAIGLGAPAVVGALAAIVGWAVLGAMISVASIGAALPLASLEIPEQGRGVAAAIVASILALAGSPRGRAIIGWFVRHRGVTGATRRGISPAGHRPRASVPRSSERRAARAGLLAAVATLATLLLVGATRPDARLRMTVLDVGQGDAILLEGPRGGRILVDGGPDPDRLLIELDRRLPPWDRRLDLFVLTHPHEDHVGGLALLLSRYRVRAIGEPGMRGPGPGYAAFVAALHDLDLERRIVHAGQRLRLDGVRVDVRWPPIGGVPREPPNGGTGINNVSIVLDVRHGARRLLLNGDVEEEVDPRLASDGAIGPVDVLKVAHHGSRTASTAAFLAVARPRLAIVSAGRGNPYGHPAPDTLERLREVGARVLRTDEHGSVTVSTDGHDLRVEESGPRETRTSVRAPAPGSVGRVATGGSRNTPGPGAGVFAVLFACDLPSGRQGAVRSGRARPRPSRGGRSHHRTRPAALVRDPRRGGGGDRRLPGPPCERTGAGRGPRPGRGSRAPP